MDLTFMQAFNSEGSSGYAMIGFSVGLALAVVEYAALSPARVRAGERGDVRGKRLLFWIAAGGFIVNPVVGYMVGSLL